VNTDGVEQLTRYLDLLNRDPLLAPVRGIFAAQEIKPQARVLAADRGITCTVLDYEVMRGNDRLQFEATVVEGGVRVRKTAGQGQLF
jgi:RecB family endonuclease NucS